MKITLDLTEKEIELLRNSTSDLGTKESECCCLQLKIAHAILDAKYPNATRRYDGPMGIFEGYGEADPTLDDCPIDKNFVSGDHCPITD